MPVPSVMSAKSRVPRPDPCSYSPSVAQRASLATYTVSPFGVMARSKGPSPTLTVAFTAFANVTGLPAISLPVHESESLPIGAQLIGSPFDEATLIRLASALEQALPWADRRPAVAGAGEQAPAPQ